MEKKSFTPQTLMEYLIERYKDLNDGGEMAKKMYDMIMSNNTSIK